MSNRSMLIAEKRVRYRTGTDLLSVTLLDMTGSKTKGRILDVSAGGVGVFVRPHQHPHFGTGRLGVHHLAAAHRADRRLGAGPPHGGL